MMTHRKSLPVFEILTAFYFLYLATVMFLFPELIGSDKSAFYENIAAILPPVTWSFVVFFIGSVLCIGLYSNKTPIRTAGLLMASVVYLIFAFAFARSFPNFSTGLYVLLTMGAFSAIATIKRTEL